MEKINKMINKIINLLKSPVVEDVRIGIQLLVKDKDQQDIIDFFDTFGTIDRDRRVEKESYLSKGVFNRNLTGYFMGDWIVYHTENVGFLIGRFTAICTMLAVERIKSQYHTEEL